jgi:hypothetical protein
MIIKVSNSELCGISSDGGMFLNMKLYNDMNKKYCIALGGEYTLFIKQLENFCKEKDWSN